MKASASLNSTQIHAARLGVGRFLHEPQLPHFSRARTLRRAENNPRPLGKPKQTGRPAAAGLFAVVICSQTTSDISADPRAARREPSRVSRGRITEPRLIGFGDRGRTDGRRQTRLLSRTGVGRCRVTIRTPQRRTIIVPFQLQRENNQ